MPTMWGQAGLIEEFERVLIYLKIALQKSLVMYPIPVWQSHQILPCHGRINAYSRPLVPCAVLGFGVSNGFVMHEFEELLARLLGGATRDIPLRTWDDGQIIRLRGLRCWKEKLERRGKWGNDGISSRVKNAIWVRNNWIDGWDIRDWRVRRAPQLHYLIW